MTAMIIMFALLYPFLGDLPNIRNHRERVEALMLACTFVLAIAVLLLNIFNGGKPL